ncbi:hypothetical protein LshimejAT787_0410280 [Lyophyllum shimeji]|uniref:Uncharacterized protein n=1 Tax=Lyophyllum shimeji TaxID=47721 RepID=A0A9P3UM44_LYOSH|nr:hypothetical protein LshimejAT787_0410280 [Lyophyllum shimeji]
MMLLITLSRNIPSGARIYRHPILQIIANPAIIVNESRAAVRPVTKGYPVHGQKLEQSTVAEAAIQNLHPFFTFPLKYREESLVRSRDEHVILVTVYFGGRTPFDGVLNSTLLSLTPTCQLATMQITRNVHVPTKLLRRDAVFELTAPQRAKTSSASTLSSTSPSDACFAGFRDLVSHRAPRSMSAPLMSDPGTRNGSHFGACG